MGLISEQTGNLRRHVETKDWMEILELNNILTGIKNSLDGLTVDWGWQKNESVTWSIENIQTKEPEKDWRKIKRTSETCGQEQANGLIYAFILRGWCNLDSKTGKEQ